MALTKPLLTSLRRLLVALLTTPMGLRCVLYGWCMGGVWVLCVNIQHVLVLLPPLTIHTSYHSTHTLPLYTQTPPPPPHIHPHPPPTHRYIGQHASQALNLIQALEPPTVLHNMLHSTPTTPLAAGVCHALCAWQAVKVCDVCVMCLVLVMVCIVLYCIVLYV